MLSILTEKEKQIFLVSSVVEVFVILDTIGDSLLLSLLLQSVELKE
jgi:hypothetical protein